MRLVVADDARADIQEISDYIASDSPRAARRIIAQFREDFRELKKRPYANAFVSSRENKDIRRKVSGNYLILYRVRDHIEIIRVLHGARDYGAFLD